MDWGKVKGAFVVETPEPAKTYRQDNTGAPTKPSGNSIIPIWDDAARHSASSLAAVSVKLDESLMRTLKSRIYPISGPLSVFLATFNSLASAIPEEATRLSAAINVCTAQGGSIGGILSDIGSANAKLTTEKQNFETARANKLNTDIDSRDARIATLSQEIVSLTADRDRLVKETESLRDEVNTKTVNYTAALGQITADLDAMERKLKGAK